MLLDSPLFLGTFSTALTLSGSVLMHSADSMTPKNLISFKLNSHFSKLDHSLQARLMPFLLSTRVLPDFLHI